MNDRTKICARGGCCNHAEWAVPVERVGNDVVSDVEVCSEHLHDFGAVSASQASPLVETLASSKATIADVIAIAEIIAHRGRAARRAGRSHNMELELQRSIRRMGWSMPEFWEALDSEGRREELAAKLGFSK